MLRRNALFYGKCIFKSLKSLKHHNKTLFHRRNSSSYLLEDNFKSRLEKLPAENADNVFEYEELEKKDDEVFSVASYEQASQRNFFATDRIDDRAYNSKITFQMYKHIKDQLKEAVDLETKQIVKKLPRDIQVSMYKLLSTAKYYEDNEAFVKDGYLERWWIVFSRFLQWADPVTLQPMYTAEKIARTLNSFLKLNTLTETSMPKSVFVDRLKTMIETIYERDTILTSKSLAMLLGNTRKIIKACSFTEADSDSPDAEQLEQVPSWLKDRLNQFLLRFYRHLPGIERLDANSDHSSKYGYETKEHTLIAMYYATSLGVRTPTDKRVLRLLANIFHDVLLSDDPYQTSDKPLIQQVRFSKALFVCDVWDFDMCVLCTRSGVAADRQKSWHKLYAIIGELLQKRPARLGNEKDCFVQMGLLLNSLIVACKYSLEDIFVAELMSYWKLYYRNPNMIPAIQRKILANTIRAGRFGQKANKYSDIGICAQLSEIIC